MGRRRRSRRGVVGRIRVTGDVSYPGIQERLNYDDPPEPELPQLESVRLPGNYTVIPVGWAPPRRRWWHRLMFWRR